MALLNIKLNFVGFDNILTHQTIKVNQESNMAPFDTVNTEFNFVGFDVICNLSLKQNHK